MRFLKNVFGLVTDNWWLKLIALLLAVVVYHGTRTERLDNSKHTSNDSPILQQFR